MATSGSLATMHVFEVRLLLAAHEGDVELSALELVGEHGRVVARNPDFDVEQLVAEEARRVRQPLDFLPGEKPDREGGLRRLRGAPRRLCRRFRLGQRQPRMVEEGATRRRQLDAVDAAGEQRDADLIFEIADLPAQ